MQTKVALPTLATSLLGIGLAWYATRVAPYAPVFRRRKVRVPSTWPPLEILHLSDLHLRRSDPGLLQAEMSAVCGLERQADLVCVTGDVCERQEDAPLVAELLRDLKPRLGTFVILGNHEYGAGSPKRTPGARDKVASILNAIYGPTLSSGIEDGEATGRALAELGVQVLMNEGVRLEVESDSLWLAGVDDGWAGRADVAAAMHGRKHDEGALVLIHEPELAFPAVEHGADLVLAGHTHGGQVRLPVIGAPYWHRVDKRLHVPAGLQQIGAAQLHISAGMGQLFPLRFRCPPELVWLQCVPTDPTTTSTETKRVHSRAPFSCAGTSPCSEDQPRERL
jgi:predicted MPP superfamily phosphohydrolase